jgi:hypothetical protein
MRYLTLEKDGRPHVALQRDDELVAVVGGENRTLSDLLTLAASEREAELQPGTALDGDVRVGAPVRPASIVCIA